MNIRPLRQSVRPSPIFLAIVALTAAGGVGAWFCADRVQPLSYVSVFVLVIAGGVFVLEAGSVMIQTVWFKHTRRKFGEGRRVFLMAPLHHHFEKKGWYESQVVARFYILGILFAVLALSTLKLR